MELEPSRTSVLRSLIPVAVVTLASVAAMVWTHQLWRADLSIPFGYGGDGLPSLMHVVQVMQNGWIWTDPRLGAPFTQHFVDFPMPDVLMLLEVKALALFVSSWFVIFNLLYLLTYPSIAVAAWWVMRKMGVSAWPAVVMALLYTFLPYHSVRFEYHLFLSGYFTVPLGVYLAVTVLSGEALFVRRLGRGRVVQWCTLVSLRTVLFAIVISLSGTYYTAFTALLLVLAFGIRMLTTPGWRPVVNTALILGLMTSTFLVVTNGTLRYHAQFGANPSVGTRPESDVELYSLKISQLLLPGYHRIDSWTELRRRYIETFPVPSEGWATALGLVGAAGLLWLLAVAFVSLIRRLPDGATQRHRQFAVLSVALIVIGTFGGLSTLMSIFVFSEIRNWNRVSIILGFFALTAVGLGLDRLLTWCTRRRLRPLGPIALVAVLAFGLWDQTNSTWVPPYAETAVTFNADTKYFAAIEARMDAGSNIFELPDMSFPESGPVGEVNTYDLLRPYLHTTTLKWSYAGMRGRLESAWRDRLLGLSPSEFLQALVATDFDGLYVDRAAFQGVNQPQIFTETFVADVARLLGSDAVINDPVLPRSFFDLRAYRASIASTDAVSLDALREILLFPVYPGRYERVFPLETNAAHSFYWADGADASMFVANATDAPIASAISFEVYTATGADADFTVTWPDGQETHIRAGREPVTVSRTLSLPPNASEIVVSTDAPRVAASLDSRDLRFAIEGFDVSPPS